MSEKTAKFKPQTVTVVRHHSHGSGSGCICNMCTPMPFALQGGLLMLQWHEAGPREVLHVKKKIMARRQKESMCIHVVCSFHFRKWYRSYTAGSGKKKVEMHKVQRPLQMKSADAHNTTIHRRLQQFQHTASARVHTQF